MQGLLKVDLEPTLYNVLESYILFSNKTLLATFADDAAMLAAENDPIFDVDALQPHLNKIMILAKKWKIKNQSESISC